RDSASVLSRSRSAQAGFERFRYLRLPRTHQSAGGGECHEIIGRFCFWFEPDPRVPPPEAPAIGERRRALLDRLAEAADHLPGDGWIAGQRVRYLVEAGEEDDALAAARACRATPWWCAALRGYALHEAQRFTEAEVVFDSALTAMPAEERARWTDVEELLRPDDQREYRRATEEERARLARGLWWLGDPLWSDAGNDRLTEHYARWTMHIIQQHARQVDRLAWRDDLREIVVRYGWFTAWERYVPMFYSGSGEGMVAYNDPRTWEWLVPLSAVREPRTLRGDEWPLLESTPTATRYAPEYAARVTALPHQVAVFPRPGGAVLVAGYALPADSLPEMPRIHAAAVVMTDMDGPRILSPWHPTATSGALRVALPESPAVLSLEVREDSTRTVARQRQGVSWDADARVSDLLLLAHPDARPEDLDEAARIARGSADVRPGERVGVFWEMYGLPDGDSITVRVGLMAPQAGWARRRLEAIGLARGARPVRMGWREATDGAAIAPRSVTVGIPADLRPGDYTLEISITGPGRPAAVARRTITVQSP
ncbi:MAG TPA: hypothetical protein VM759_13205, partial [Longimicrobium sp.]|nr:hypothetical protein [Longimicrobium sp.]